MACRTATSEQEGPTSICRARGSLALRTDATLSNSARGIVTRSAWQQKGAAWSAVMTIASSEASSFWSAMQLGLEADAEGGAEAEAQEERDLLPCLCCLESSLLPRLPSVDRDGVGFKTSRRN